MPSLESSRPQPYVGISGIGEYEQHGDVVDIALAEGLLSSDYFVMLGVQATSKSQILDIENSRGRAWHPVGDEISRAAANEDSGLTKPYVHCFFLPDEFEQGVASVMRRTFHFTRGLQLNMLPWMDQDFSAPIGRIKERHPNLDIVLQANGPILEAYSPDEIAARAGRMGLIDYVLIDASHGFGKPLDVAETRPYVDALYARSDRIGAVVAGGLDAETVGELFGPLADEFPGLSCDAEGRLRTMHNGRSLLDMDKVSSYVHAWKQAVDL